MRGFGCVTLPITFVSHLEALVLEMALKMQIRSKSLIRSLCNIWLGRVTIVIFCSTPSGNGLFPQQKLNDPHQFSGSYWVDRNQFTDGLTDDQTYGQMDTKGETHTTPKTNCAGGLVIVSFKLSSHGFWYWWHPKDVMITAYYAKNALIHLVLVIQYSDIDLGKNWLK